MIGSTVAGPGYRAPAYAVGPTGKPPPKPEGHTFNSWNPFGLLDKAAHGESIQPKTFNQWNPFALLGNAQNQLQASKTGQVNKKYGGIAGPDATAPSPTGTESGPGILENWFNQRAQGVDAASEYARKRGMDALGDRYGAAGLSNSGAARQGESDLLANIEAQRAGQLDALAGGASGEHQGRLNSMFSQGLGLAGGRSGINTAYDIKGADAWSNALAAALGFGANKAGVDEKSRQSGITNSLGIASLFA